MNDDQRREWLDNLAEGDEVAVIERGGVRLARVQGRNAIGYIMLSENDVYTLSGSSVGPPWSRRLEPPTVRIRETVECRQLRGVIRGADLDKLTLSQLRRIVAAIEGAEGEEET